MARYGFLLIPLYRLDSSTGMWSVRENVRKAVCQDINSKRFNSGRRSDYVAVATECIYSLHKLFNHQAKDTHTADVQQELQEPSVTRTEDNTTTPVSDIQPAFGVFGSVSQVQRYLRRLSVLGSKASTWSSSPILRPFVATTPLPAPQDSLPSESNYPAGPALGLWSNWDSMIVQGHYHSQTSLILPPSLTLPSDSSQSVSRRASGGSAYSRCESVAFANLSTPDATISHPSVAESKSSDKENALKRPSPLAILRRGLSAAEEKLNATVAAALMEISSDHLEEELREVDCCPLTKEMRWFAIPIEVAKVYTSQEQQEQRTFPSCFPKHK